jgi:hypothetical protein
MPGTPSVMVSTNVGCFSSTRTPGPGRIVGPHFAIPTFEEFVQAWHRTLALGVFHQHLTRNAIIGACAVERHVTERRADMRRRLPRSTSFTGCATVSDDAHADQDHRERAAGTGVCDRHRLTVKRDSRPRLSEVGRADRLRSSGPQSTRPVSCDLLADRSRHQTFTRTAGVPRPCAVASHLRLAGGCKLTRRYRRARRCVSPPSGPVSTRAE